MAIGPTAAQTANGPSTVAVRLPRPLGAAPPVEPTGLRLLLGVGVLPVPGQVQRPTTSAGPPAPTVEGEGTTKGPFATRTPVPTSLVVQHPGKGVLARRVIPVVVGTDHHFFAQQDWPTSRTPAGWPSRCSSYY